MAIRVQQVNEKQRVKVQVKNFIQLFTESTHAIAIDNYQRPFVWKEDKIGQLISDLNEYKQERKTSDLPLDYFMGALLLHHNEEALRFYVIDGQQRLTSLCILHHLINSTLPPQCDFTYRNPESVTNIHDAQKYFMDAQELHDPDLLNHIVFTVIEVPSEDLAFTFFDTQNNRGVPLNATDLLKAHHLRAITDHNGSRSELQAYCAKRWEALQDTKPILRGGTDFAPILFGQFLWRARQWTGQNQIGRETHDDIVAEFQNRSLTVNSPDTIPLFASQSNQRATHLTLTPKQGYSLNLQPIRLSEHSAGDLPFSIRQPIHKGVGFFLFAEKYTSLIEQLLRPDHPDPEIRAYAHFYQEVIEDLSVYLRELFLLASVVYVDQFGTQQLLQFALWLDHVLGAIRLKKAYIFRAAPLIFLRESTHNLLDVITAAYRPEDVIDWLKNAQIDRTDSADIIYAKEVESNQGVRGKYKQRVLAYYNSDGSLHNKSKWITPYFVEQKKAVTA